MKPVYMINGFLDAGKTEFISDLLAQPNFQIRGKTLLIVCEEGEMEYDEVLLKKSNTVMEIIEEERNFTSYYLTKLDKKHKADRIIIEYNGMWNCKEVDYPWYWPKPTQVSHVNAVTFQMYYTNMKSLLIEQIRKSDLIFFNHCDGLVEQLASYKRSLQAVNPRADMVFMGQDGEMNLIFEDDLPYELDAPVIKLDNMGYGVFYMDSLENPDRYEGKKVEFVAMSMKPQGYPDNIFIAGRMAMTCCADDMQLLGFICEYEKTKELENKEWVKVEADIHIEEREEFEGRGPVMAVTKLEKTAKPKDAVIGF